MFTSGTTSAPKGVVVTQANYAFAGDVMAAMAGLTRFDRQFVVLPMFHANAQYYSFASAISAGASVALMHAFSASRPPGTQPLTLRHAWFAQNLSTEQYRDISQLLGCRPRQIYGMTETAPAVLANPPIGSIPTAMGTPTLGCHVRVVDTDRHPIAPDATGSIQVGGHPGTTIFAGYLDDPATTEASIVDRRSDGFVWFDTGDRATVDALGFHYFAGRRSDVLKVAGENVSTVEVEHALAEHPAVREVAVVGAPDAVLDEVPEAFVVLRDATVVPDDVEDQLAAWAARHLAPSKRPRAYHVVSELPRTSVGKIRKFLLHSDAGRPPDQATEGTRE
jgi:crotonobetaine/carnitine-CoA ligase